MGHMTSYLVEICSKNDLKNVSQQPDVILLVSCLLERLRGAASASEPRTQKAMYEMGFSVLNSVLILLEVYKDEWTLSSRLSFEDTLVIGSITSQQCHVLSTRKNKLVSGEDLGDGIRRQGRTGQGFTSTRSLMPMSVEKPSNVGTAKQLGSARVGFDKAESKAGRPPTLKLSDRRAYTRQRHTVVNATADFLVGSDDGHEELLAAVNALMPAPTHSRGRWSRSLVLYLT